MGKLLAGAVGIGIAGLTALAISNRNDVVDLKDKYLQLRTIGQSVECEVPPVVIGQSLDFGLFSCLQAQGVNVYSNLGTAMIYEARCNPTNWPNLYDPTAPNAKFTPTCDGPETAWNVPGIRSGTITLKVLPKK